MKKLLFVMAVLTLLAGVSSCQKEREGKYTPKEKVQSVYQEQTWYQNDEMVRQEAKFKSEEWTWTNDQLDSITYYEQHIYLAERCFQISPLIPNLSLGFMTDLG